MRLHRHAWMFLCCALPPLVQACGRPGDPGLAGDRPPELAPIEAQPLPGVGGGAGIDDSAVNRMLVGELRFVDPERAMLVVRTSEGSFDVAYTDETEVVGSRSGVQGLAPRAGSRVTVYYRIEPDGGRTAVRIETR